jgi:ribulose 1,5-bisphosphate synthetase/thiazole synthase
MEYDIIIIGGGPAGLSAGIYASRLGAKTLILEKLNPGGQITLSSILLVELEKLGQFHLDELFHILKLRDKVCHILHLLHLDYQEHRRRDQFFRFNRCGCFRQNMNLDTV